MPEQPKLNLDPRELITATLSRRGFLKTASAAVGGFAVAQRPAGVPITRPDTDGLPPYGNSTIPPGVRSRGVGNVNGLTVHMLEAGFETPGRPAVLLLHGFPELAYSWRKVMVPLASAGYHVIAPDQRGYGRTTGWDGSYDADPDPFRILNMVRDAIGLVYALGHRSVAMVAGHDAGAPVASWAALIRPDIFRSVTILSSPFEGAPSLLSVAMSSKTPLPPFATGDLAAFAFSRNGERLATLSPRGKVQLWSLPQKQRQTEIDLPSPTDASYGPIHSSPDGHHVLVGHPRGAVPVLRLP